MEKNKFQLKREATYEKLMTAGLEVFCEKGYSSTTINDISKKAGYTRGAFYVQFEDKEDFFHQLIKYRRKTRANTHENLESLFEAGEGLQEALTYLAEGIVTYITKSPEWIFVYVDYFMQTKDKDNAQEMFKSYYKDWIAETKGNLDWLYRKGLIPQEANTIENAKQIYAILDGYITHHNLYDEALDGSKLAAAMLKLLR